MRRLKFLLALLTAALGLAGAASAATQFQTVVPSRASITANYTSAAAATIQNVKVLESGHYLAYSWSPSSTATVDGNTVIAASDAPTSGRWLQNFGFMSGNVTWNICASSFPTCNYATLSGAQQAIGLYAWAPNATLTLQLPCGAAVTETSALTLFDWTPMIPRIVGCAPTINTVNSIVSSSGSAYSWSLVLQMAGSVAAFTPNNDYITIRNASAGTNPKRLNGTFPVTAINTGSNQITVSSFNGAAAPSGSVTATACGLSSRVNFTDSSTGYAGINTGPGNWLMGNFVLVGNGMAGNGLAPQIGGVVQFIGPVAVDNFGAGVEISDQAKMQLTAYSTCGTGLYITRAQSVGFENNLGGFMDADPLIVTGTSAGPNVQLDTGSITFDSNIGPGVAFEADGGADDGILISGNATLVDYVDSSDNGISGTGYGIHYVGGSADVLLQTFTATNNATATCNTSPSSCSQPTLGFGATVGSGQPLQFGDTSSFINRTIGAVTHFFNNNGAWFSGGAGVDIDNSYTNPGANALNVGAQYFVGGVLFANSSSPTISSGFGTSPTACTTCGTAAFFFNVGTGGTATNGVLSMPAPHPAHWACNFTDTTSNATIVAGETGSTGSTVSVQAYLRTGAATAFGSADNVNAQCTPIGG